MVPGSNGGGARFGSKVEEMSEAKGNGAAHEGGGLSREAEDTLVGRVVNERFRILERIARGGMGKVYKAEQLPLGRLVALKVLDVRYQGEEDPSFHKRFFLEASICAKLTNPHTVTIFDYGRTEDDVYFIAMELLEGRTLHQALREEGAFAPERAVSVTLQICSSLQEAHKRGVIHRDLKPANIFLTQHGEQTDFVKVLDFGLVKDFTNLDAEMTQTGLFMGSPKYMAPEQIQRRPVDPRTDIYSLGVILYTMLAGRVPFDSGTPVDILMAQINQPPPLLAEANPQAEVPGAIEEVVRRMLRKDPSDRYGSVGEVRRALLEAASQCGLLPQSSDVTLSGEWAQHTMTGSVPSMPPISGQRSLPPDAPSASHSFATANLPSEERRGRHLGLWLGGLGALAILAMAGVFLLGGDEEPSAASPSAAAETPTPARAAEAPAPASPIPGEPSAPSPAEPAVEPPPAEAPAPARVLLVLDSAPPGAKVRVGDREYGPTPVEVELVGEEAAPGSSLELRFVKSGFYDYTASRVVVAGEPIRVTARLRRRFVRRAGRRDKETTKKQGEEVVIPPPLRGYKDDPY